MGRRRFRLADMMPNSWFYKLRDMRRARGAPHAPATAGGGMLSSSSSPRGTRPAAATRTAASPRRGPAALPHRTSYYYASRDRELPAPQPSTAATEDEDRQRVPQPQLSPPASSRRRHRVGTVRVGRGLELVAEAPDASPRRRRDMYVIAGEEDVGEARRTAVAAAPSKDKVIASETDIVIDLRAEGAVERVLRPIVTRPARKEVVRCELKDRRADAASDATTPRASSASEQGGKAHPRRSSVSTGRRLKTRVGSPRLQASARPRNSKLTTPSPSPRKKAAPLAPAPPPPLAESFAVVKASADPRRDFRESMEEMIAEKGIRGAADLEDLLACYLALNAAEHHDLIVEVFEQIWTGLAGAKP